MKHRQFSQQTLLTQGHHHPPPRVRITINPGVMNTIHAQDQWRKVIPPSMVDISARPKSRPVR